MTLLLARDDVMRLLDINDAKSTQVKNNYFNIVKYLVENGADIHYDND